MLLWAFFGVFQTWPPPGQPRTPFLGSLLLFVIIGLLGWQTFGAAIHR